jgi:thiol-disulfide isomerase/thioredoxin
MQSADAPLPDALLVACLCAQWCGTCRDYRALFDQLQGEFPTAVFRWIDVEDQADLVDPVEVDDFPTVLIAAQGQARFFGTLTPHIETLRRLIQAQQVGSAGTVPSAPVQALAGRLSAAIV